jgi:aspartokinase-like uncharacterized kinase
LSGDSPVIVVKVGGSLLDWPGLPAALTRFLAEQAARRVVLVAGGGRAADVIRELDRTHGLGESVAHAVALRSLDLTAHALAAIVPGLAVVERAAELGRVWDTGSTPVLAPRVIVEADDAVEQSWRVTSDSIAARVGVLLGVRELVLLKSATLPAGVSRLEAVRRGVVDEAFTAVSAPIERVFYRNLRDFQGASVCLA